MQVFSYTDDKTVTRVYLSNEEIVRMEIDPWRLDLFDPDPVRIVRQHEPTLHFRRLRDVSFGYRKRAKEPEFIVGLHDGSEQICLSGRAQSVLKDFRTIERIALSDVKPVAEHFRHHWKKYLDCMDRGPLNYLVQKYIIHKSEEHSGYAPADAGAISLSGNTLNFAATKMVRGNSLGWMLMPCEFTGEMFAPARVQMQLPPCITDVFSEFGEYHPVVLGEALRKVLQGMTPKVVEFQVPTGSLKALRRYLSQRYDVDVFEKMIGDPMVDFSFDKGDISYVVSSMSGGIDEAFSSRNFYSADRLFATSDGTIHSCRIGLHDIGNLCARKLGSFSCIELGEEDRTASLEKDGFRIPPSNIDGPTGP